MTMYLTLKALHLIAVISWMVGLLYLPRIFVYHAEVKTDSEACCVEVVEVVVVDSTQVVVSVWLRWWR